MAVPVERHDTNHVGYRDHTPSVPPGDIRGNLYSPIRAPSATDIHFIWIPTAYFNWGNLSSSGGLREAGFTRIFSQEVIYFSEISEAYTY